MERIIQPASAVLVSVCLLTWVCVPETCGAFIIGLIDNFYASVVNYVGILIFRSINTAPVLNVANCIL